MKKGKWIGAAAALALAGSLTVSPAMAFFTANAEASGVRGIRFEMGTELEETIESNKKTAAIKNTGKNPCWVRVKFFCGEGSAEGLAPEIKSVTGTNWEKGAEDWYYYTVKLEAPESDGKVIKTEELTAEYTAPKKTSEYDIIVVYEYMPYMGEAAYTEVDWKLKADTSRTGAESGAALPEEMPAGGAGTE